MYLSLLAGTTSKIIQIPIYDSSSAIGAKLAGLVYNTASLTAYYNREGAAGAATAITLATATKGTWATGGFIAIDATNIPGSYELHVPDAALASGAKSVLISLKGAANMVPVDILIELTAIDNQDAVRGGMTSLPASGTLAVNPTLAAVTHTGAVIPTVSAVTGLTASNLDAAISSRMAAYTQPTGFLAATFPTGTVANTTNITAGTVTTGAVAANAITAAAIADGAIDRATFAADTGMQSIRSSTAQAGAAATITLDASASAVDSFYNELWVYVTGGTGIGQVRAITAYIGATKVATITPNWITNPDATSTFALRTVSRNDAISSGTTDWSTAEKNQIRQSLGVDGTKAATSSGNLDTVLADTTNIKTRIPTVLVSGRIDSSVGSNLDKTGYGLSSAAIQAIWDALTSALTTVGSIGKLFVDNVNATISSRSSHTAADIWTSATRTVTSFGTLISDIWANATRTITGGTVTTNNDKTGYSISGTKTTLDALNDISVSAILTTALTESYAADGAAPTLAQALFMLLSEVGEFAISGTTITCKRLDGTTTSMTFTLDSSTTPTSRTRTT